MSDSVQKKVNRREPPQKKNNTNRKLCILQEVFLEIRGTVAPNRYTSMLISRLSYPQLKKYWHFHDSNSQKDIFHRRKMAFHLVVRLNSWDFPIAHENPIFPGKYQQNGGFSMAMLVYRSVDSREFTDHIISQPAQFLSR